MARVGTLQSAQQSPCDKMSQKGRTLRIEKYVKKWKKGIEKYFSFLYNKNTLNLDNFFIRQFAYKFQNEFK